MHEKIIAANRTFCRNASQLSPKTNCADRKRTGGAQITSLHNACYSGGDVHCGRFSVNGLLSLLQKKDDRRDLMPRWKKEQYMDASGAWRMPDDDYVDYSGAWRSPDDHYVDASGAWRGPNDWYFDEAGGWRQPGEQYMDHSGGWRY